MRRVAIGVLLAGLASPAATATAATRVAASGDVLRTVGGVQGPFDTGGTLDGGAGNDMLEDRSPGAGYRTAPSFVLSGGSGNDVVRDFGGRDLVRGDEGDDLLATGDGRGDRVDCGAGNDVAEIDASDVTVDCETIRRLHVGASVARIRALAAGTLRVAVRCPAEAEDSCDGRLRITDAEARVVDSLPILVSADSKRVFEADLSRRMRRRLRRGRSVGIRVTTRTFEGSSEFNDQVTVQRFVLRRSRTIRVP